MAMPEQHQVCVMIPQPALHIQRLPPVQPAPYEPVVDVDIDDAATALLVCPEVECKLKLTVIAKPEAEAIWVSSLLLDGGHDLAMNVPLKSVIDPPLVIPLD